MEDFLFLPEWLRGLQSGFSVTQDPVISDSVFGPNQLYLYFQNFCNFLSRTNADEICMMLQRFSLLNMKNQNKSY